MVAAPGVRAAEAIPDERHTFGHTPAERQNDPDQYRLSLIAEPR